MGVRIAVIVSLTAATLTAVGDGREARADCGDPFADPDDVLDFRIRITDANWDALRNTDPVGNGCDAQYPYFDVEFRCGDEPWIAIGARRKRGDQRGKDTNEKPPIKLDFNRTVPGQRWPATLGNLGLRRLSLNNGQEDNPGGVLSALLTEHYAWRLMVAEVPRSSRVAYARLTVELTGPTPATEYHGLYIVIEDLDRTAIRRRFGGDEGTLLKTTQGGCRNQVVFDDGGENPSSAAFDAWGDLDPGDFAGTWANRTDESIDLDELLRAEALRDVLANGADTVLGTNFSNFVSFDSLDPARARRHYLPWDLDDVFRPFPQDVASTRPIESGCSAVGDLTRCDPEVRERYLSIACQLTNGTLHQDKLLAELAELDALVAPIVADEVGLVWPQDDPFDGNQDGTYASELNRMQTWIPERIASVRGQIEAEGVACPEGCTSGESEPCPFADCAGERRCEQGRWTTCEVPPETGQDSTNGLDDDCDGRIDEGATNPGDLDAGPANPDDPPSSGGCGCQTGGSSGSSGSSSSGDPLFLLLFVLALALTPRRRRRDQTPRLG